MKSPRPDNCFRRCDISRTLDTWAGQPECNQGGMVICASTAQANAEIMEDKAPTLMAGHEHPYIASFCGGASPSAGNIGYSETVAQTLRAGAGGSSGATVCIENTVYDMTHASDVIRECAGASQTLTERMGTGGNQIPCKLDEARPAVYFPRVARTLTAEADASFCIDRGQNVVCYDACGNGDDTHRPTLTCNHGQPISAYGGRPPRKYIIRRLTPLECCRLQGFPDDWTAGVEGSDAAQYKMWGNGMALPCVLYVMQGIKGAEK